MTETDIKKTTVLEAFLKQREKRQNDTGIQAQKLVNLYRHLGLFGDGFLTTYNKMLIDSSADVQMALSDVMGGMIVRQYLDFLRTKQQKSDEELEGEEKPLYETESSYLPAADEIEPFQGRSSAIAMGTSIGGNPVDSESALKNQSVFLEQALTKQTEFLGKAMAQMQENLSQQLAVSPIKESGDEATVPDMTRVLEQILEKQNQVLVDSLKQVFENSAEITAKQMETFELVLQNNLSQGAASYPEVEEYTPEAANTYTPMVTYLVPDKIKNSPVPPRAYHPEPEESEIVPMEEITSASFVEPIPKPIVKLVPQATVLDEDVEILSEIDLPTKPSL